MEDPSENPPENPNQLISMEHMQQLFQMFQTLNKNSTNIELGTSQIVRVAEKLNFTNYTKWCKLMQIAIGGRGRLNHIIVNPISPDNPEYQQWAQKDSMVISWIIENIDGDLVNQFLDYKTARDLWKGIETLLSSGRDELQIYDLNTKATSMKQGIDTIEVYFSKLNTLWKEIDRRMSNPMKCAEDITLFNSFIQRQRLYQFLAGVNDSLDKEKRDILNLDPLPTIDAAYATIRREISRRGIMTGNSSLERGPSEIGSGLVTQRRSDSSFSRSDSSFRREDKTHLKCSHCGGTKHTKEGCFKLIGYPEWWEDLRQRKAATKVTKTGSKANATIGEGEPTSKASSTTVTNRRTGTGEASSTSVTDRRTGTSGKNGFTKVSGEPWMETEEATGRRREKILEESSSRNERERKQEALEKSDPLPLVNQKPKKSEAQLYKKPKEKQSVGLMCNKSNWIFDCGATDTMSYDPSDFLSFTSTTRTKIQTANGEFIPITQAEDDAQTGRIIGRGIERGGLYYVNEVTQQGNALLAQGSSEYQIWMWHRRLGHPSLSYLKRLFPSFKDIDFVLDCEACLGPQGETTNDDLSWLIYPEMMDLDPPTQVSNTADVNFETSVSAPSPQSTPMTTTEHPESTSVKVNSESCTVPTDSVSSDNCQNRYELPHRSTRGVPPKRYDPEYEDQRSRYPIERISNENLSNTAVAFTTSLYSTNIPRIVYILDLLTETGMLGGKPADTPIVANHGLQVIEGAKATGKEQYQKIVGKLIYLAHTRPDIAYAVGIVSRFMHLPQIHHMTAVMRILRYLKGTSSTGIYFGKNDSLDIIAYTDADWAGDRDERKSTSGYFTLVGGNLVTWRSKKQKVVALSSAEAEFRGIVKGITEILWIRKLLNELACSCVCNVVAVNSSTLALAC
uniref:GAG-pre-integrase domain-containing protein n=1 Tax=Solanum lycopersicum TaxID=4081 RepID=A0A3Q7F038_SOLLC